MKIDGVRSGGSVKRGREQDKKSVESIKAGFSFTVYHANYQQEAWTSSS